MKIKKFEREIAKLVGGRRHLASGSMGKKGDASDNYFCYEIKKRKRSFSLNTKTVDKIWEDSLGQSKEPVIFIRLEEARYEKDWVCIPFRIFKKVKEAIDV